MKEYKIIIIDDQDAEITPIIKNVQKRFLSEKEYKVEYEILSTKNQIMSAVDKAVDVIMFDCDFSGADLDFTNYSKAQYGFELIKEYRKKNSRTKVIFYSGSFDFKNETNLPFTSEEYIRMINELHIYKLTTKEYETIFQTLNEAFDDLDPVFVGMEKLITDFGDAGNFKVGEEILTSQGLLKELKLGTRKGNLFKEDFNKMILTYIMKFNGGQ